MKRLKSFALGLAARALKRLVAIGVAFQDPLRSRTGE
jgi:hypothetical protein